MAFADGELDEQVAATVEQAMASDPAIAKRISEFLRSRRLIRSAFSEETLSDVSPELRAAVLAQIDHFEGQGREQPSSGLQVPRSAPLTGMWRSGMALAASIAVLALVTAGYLAGRQGMQPPSSGPIAHLATPEVNRVLSESPSGQELDLSFGRMRVISTFRTANGSLCREFKLQVSTGTSDAVACRDRDWMITFAVASTGPSASYVPSGGADLMASYLQNTGAGEPLVDEAEIRALGEVRRQK
jgi:anti-sigma factor RsiW